MKTLLRVSLRFLYVLATAVLLTSSSAAHSTQIAPAALESTAVFCSSNPERYFNVLKKKLKLAGLQKYQVYRGEIQANTGETENATLLYAGTVGGFFESDCVEKYIVRILHKDMGWAKNILVERDVAENFIFPNGSVGRAISKTIVDPENRPRKWVFGFCFQSEIVCENSVLDVFVKLISGEHK